MAALLILSLTFAPVGVTAGENRRSQGEEPLLEWSRTGGFAGFCDRLTVTDDGVAVALSCRRAQREIGRCRLDPDHEAELARWRSELAPFTWTHEDPATADAMTTELRFGGKGDRAVTPDERAAVLNLAATLFAQATATKG